MTRTPIVLALTAAAVLAAAGCADEEAAKARDDAIETRMRAEIDRARKEQSERTSQQIQAARDDVRSLREQVGFLEERVAALEARPAGAGAGAPGAGAVVDPSAAAKAAAEAKKAKLEELRSLQEKVFAGTATEDEQRRYWELAREAAVLDEIMKSLEGKVAEHPDDIDARMNLGQAYVAKVMSVPDGPLKGLWSQKAMGQWQAVLKQDPDHWDARYSVALSWSFWPEQFNKTPDAIREFEKLREVQERQTVDEKHAGTYLQLSRLYQKQGKSEKATDVLRAGLARHPNDAELRKALGAAED